MATVVDVHRTGSLPHYSEVDSLPLRSQDKDALPGATSDSPPQTSRAILMDAMGSLSAEQQETVRTHMLGNITLVNATLEEVQGQARTLQRTCKEKTWKIDSREINVGKQSAKVLGLLRKIRSIGDVVANIDPVHVGLPWVGVRLLLEVNLPLVTDLRNRQTDELGCAG